MTIFGISILDNLDFPWINNFFIEIRHITYSIVDYLSNTQFYKYLNQLFSSSESVKQSSNQSRSVIESNKIETIKNETKLEKIAEILKSLND